MPGTRAPRKTNIPFGDTSPADIGVFGSLAQGVPEESTDPATIQSLSPWRDGWKAAILGLNNPAIEDFNAFCFVAMYQIGYLLRNGIPEWDADTEYFNGDYVKGAGVPPPGQPGVSVIYRCVTSSDSSSVNEDPGSNPQSWRPINLEQGFNPQATPALAAVAAGTWLTESAAAARTYVNNIWIPELSKYLAVSASGYLQYSSDGKTWTEVDPAPGHKAWTSVEWSPQLQRAVVVSSDGFIMRSDVGDITAWTMSGTIPEANIFTDVVWADALKLFVAVSQNGTHRVHVSSDGDTWVVKNAASAATWNALAWSDYLGIIVAVSGDGTTMWSTDGSTWSLGTAAAANNWKKITWSSRFKFFMAVGASGASRAMFSFDGKTFASSALTEANTWTGLTDCPELGLMIAVAADGTHRIAYTLDGSNWSFVTAAEANTLSAVAWSGPLGIAALVSEDGTHRVQISTYVKKFIAV